MTVANSKVQISQLPAVSAVGDDDLLVVSQNGVASKATGAQVYANRIDRTLSIAGKAADAKAVGDKAFLVRSTDPYNTDCNELNIGSYWKDRGRTWLNGVNADPAVVVCFTPDSRAFCKVQLWFDLTNNNVYYRTKKTANDEWSAWVRIASDNNTLTTKPSLTDGDDCNDLDIGIYFKDGYVTVTNGVNSNMAVIACFTPASRPYGKAQMWFGCTDGIVYIRSAGPRVDGETVWTDWKLLADAEAVGRINDDAAKTFTGTVTNNLFDMDDLLDAQGWSESGGVYTGKLSDLFNQFGAGQGRKGISVYNGFKPNTQYTISMSAYLPIESERETTSPYTYGLYVAVKYAGDDSRKLLFRYYNDQSKFARKTATTEEGKTVENIFLTYTAKPENTWAIREMTVSEGNQDSLYTPFRRTGVDITARNNALGNSMFAGDFFSVAAEDVEKYCTPINAPSGEMPNDYYANYIANTWDTLLADYPDEVTKEQIIMDSSDTYPIYRYVITPYYYEKTVFLSAGCHGPEFGGFWGLYKLIRLMMDNGYKYPNLRKIRHKTRFVIVPVWNPWGVQQKSRLCSLGYEPNGNFGVIGDRAYDSAGRVAESCNEAKAIKMTFEAYPIDYWADLHTDPYGHNYGGYGYCIESQKTTPTLYNFTRDFHDFLRNAYDNDTVFHCVIRSGTGVGTTTYGAAVQKVPTNVLEVSEDVVPNWSTSSDFSKICIEWFGGVLSEMIGNGVI